LQLVGNVKKVVRRSGFSVNDLVRAVRAEVKFKWAVLATSALLLSGCGFDLNQAGEFNSFLDPGEIALRPLHSAPLVKPILETLDPSVEEPDDIFTNATDVTPDDLKPTEGDYRVGRNDLINVGVFDLLGEGTGETVKTIRVSESGYVALDFIKPVYALGMTEQDLQDVIRQAYQDAGQIRNARVTVTIAEQRARTFTIYGNVGGEGQYTILQNDFRLLDALVMGKGPVQTEGVEYCYIIRQPLKNPPPNPVNSAPATEPSSPAAPTTELLEPPHTAIDPVNAPRLLMASGDAPATQPGSPSALLAPDTTAPSSVVVEGGTINLHPDMASQPAATLPDSNGQITGGAGGLTGFKFAAAAHDQTRIIKVPIKELRNGHLQYNLVIRPGDTIFIPDPVTGEYYMGGHVGATGVYTLTARKITLKQAVVAAHMFDQAAMPGRSEIIRRVGPNKEVFVRVDIYKVWNGDQPDIYLKPNDIVQVGTNELAPFIAAIRNAFRVSYGFGFTYDINYAPNNGNQNTGF